MLGLYTALSVASALLAAADCFASPSPRVRPHRRSCLSTLGSRPGRPCSRVCAKMASTLPLEIKECRLFTADGGFDTAEADAFLRGYWQQQPVLLRQALPFESPISPDELAGLSLEEDVASRLIINWGALDAASRPPGKKEYELRVGPFTEDTFTTDVPETCYTLLCNEVSPLIPELSDLAARFQFIPNWRLDDIMISYAATGGGVGPHVDNYDVFLLQGRGRRRWAVGGTPISAADEDVVDGIDVRVLRGGFETAAEWELEPGDMLYVPPRFAHWGVALDDECMTYSIGFRAPNFQDLASEFANFMCDNRSPDDFYTDPSSFASQSGDAGRVQDEAVQRMWSDVANTMLGFSADSVTDAPAPEHFRRWLGGFLTQKLQRSSAVDAHARSCEAAEAVAILSDLEQGVEVCLMRNEASKLAWMPLASGVGVFADGKMWELPCSAGDDLHAGVAVLCGSHILPAHALTPLLRSPLRGIVCDWLEQGILYCPADEEDEDGPDMEA